MNINGTNYLKTIGENRLRKMAERVHNGARTIEVASELGMSRETLLKYVRLYGFKCGSKGVKAESLIGKTFNRLTVVERAQRPKHITATTDPFWKCRCTCGTFKIIRGAALKSGMTKSCGCLQRERDWRCLPIKERQRNHILSRYRTQAKARGYQFNISVESFFSMIEQECYYCGSKPDNSTARLPDYKYNGLDRVDNEKPYQPGNIVACCRMCNVAKSVHSSQEFINLCHRVAARHPKT